MRTETPTGGRSASRATIAKPSRLRAKPQAPPVEDDGITTGFHGVEVGGLKYYRAAHNSEQLDAAFSNVPHVPASVIIVETAKVVVEIQARAKTVAVIREFCAADGRRTRSLLSEVIHKAWSKLYAIENGGDSTLESLQNAHWDFVLWAQSNGRLQGYKREKITLAIDEKDFLYLVAIGEKLGLAIESMLRADLEDTAKSIMKKRASYPDWK